MKIQNNTGAGDTLNGYQKKTFCLIHRAVASRQNWDSCNSQLLLQGESIPEPILFKDIISLHNNALDCQIVENLW